MRFFWKFLKIAVLVRPGLQNLSIFETLQGFVTNHQKVDLAGVGVALAMYVYVYLHLDVYIHIGAKMLAATPQVLQGLHQHADRGRSTIHRPHHSSPRPGVPRVPSELGKEPRAFRNWERKCASSFLNAGAM